MSLPFSATDPAASEPPMGDSPFASHRIYHIEDDPDFAQLVRLLLSNLVGGQVQHFSDGLRGLQACLNAPPDLIVLDLDMPVLRGEEVCRMVRSTRELADVPIIVCSSLPEAQRRALELLGLGADAYLEKPFDENRFVETARKFLAEGRPAPSPSGGVPPSLTADQLDRLAGQPPTIPRMAPPRRPGTAASGDLVPQVLPLPGPPPPSSGQGILLPGDDGHQELTPSAGSRRSMTPTPDSASGSEIAGYRLLDILGSGGMGTVYRAVEIATNRLVALKVMLRTHAKRPELVERFLREGQIMRHLDHPGIVRIYDAGKTAYTYYISMEYVDGGTLAERAGDLTWSECATVIEQSCEAVAYLHSRGVLHRDIKLSNILVSSDGVTKLTDFGISRAGHLFDTSMYTAVGSVVGTPAYMSPEQLMGAEASETTDQYTLGRTLLAMLDPMGLRIPPRPLHEVRADLPRAVSDCLERAMDVHPTKRYPSVESMLLDITAACRASLRTVRA